MEPGLRTKLLAVATLAVVFATGGVLGYAAAADDGDAAEPAPARRSFVYEQFEPSPAQQSRIDSILRVHRASMATLNSELEEIRNRYQASSDSLSRATGDAISLVFPPEIRVEYLRRLAARRDERARAREQRADDSRGTRR